MQPTEYLDGFHDQNFVNGLRRRTFNIIAEEMMAIHGYVPVEPPQLDAVDNIIYTCIGAKRKSARQFFNDVRLMVRETIMFENN